MKCKSRPLLETTEPIENLWEIRFSKEKSKQIKNTAKIHGITLSMALRFCVFRLVDILNSHIDSGFETDQFLEKIQEKDLNLLRIPQRRPFNDFRRKKPYQQMELGKRSWNHFQNDNPMNRISATMQKCFMERQDHNRDFHRFIICLYGADEYILRQAAMVLGISVALLIRTAVELYLSELDLSADYGDEMLLKYAIKHSFVMKFHINYLNGKDGPGNYKIYSIYYPKWSYWPIKRKRGGRLPV